MQTGYADDLWVNTGTHGRHSAASNTELVLKKFQEWLQWLQTMAAKPKKCIASGLKGGKPFDPELKVWESEGKWFPKYLDDDHFKHLGKDLLADFSEAQAKKKVLAKLNEYVDLVDGTMTSPSFGSGRIMSSTRSVGSSSYMTSLLRLWNPLCNQSRGGP